MKSVFKRSATFALFLLPVLSSPAWADFVIDGSLDPGESYTTDVTATHDASAPNSNFSNPSNTVEDVGYTIQTGTDDSYWYGLFTPNQAGGGSIQGEFANLYFDLDPQNANGSDIGFEINATADTADVFIPQCCGQPDGKTYVNDIEIAYNMTTGAIEVGIPVKYFEGPVDSLPYYDGQEFVSSADPNLVLRLSQTFGYSVAGGAAYGDSRLGETNLFAAAVPEPADLAIFGSVFALLGGMAFYRRRKA